MKNKKIKNKNMNERNVIKQILLMSLLLILVIPFVNCQENKDKDLNYYGSSSSDSKIAKEFLELLDKQTAWESDDRLAPLMKQNLLKNVLKEINNVRNVENQVTSLGEAAFNNFVKELEKNGATPLFVNNLKSLRDSLKLAGVDLRRYKQPGEIKELKGFENPALKWQKGGKSVIGDGKVWLNFETLPFGVEKIEYDAKFGRFILTTKDKGRLILESGATDEKGNLKSISGLGEKGLKEFINPGNTATLSLRDFEFLKGDGEVVANGEGFSINGDGVKVRIGDFSFGRKEGERTKDSYVKFSDDRLVMKGVEYTRAGYVRTGSSSEEFIVGFGKVEQMARTTGFIDYDNDGESREDIEFIHDINGNIISVLKAKTLEQMAMGKIARDFMNGAIAISEMDEETYKKLYERSGEVVQGILKDLKEGKKINYNGLYDRFYGEEIIGKGRTGSSLTSYANELKVKESYNDFLVMNGENVAVGGSGSAEVLRDLNSLIGVNTKGFLVKSGDAKIVFNENGINTRAFTNPAKYSIGEISYKDSRGINDIENVYKLDKGASSFLDRESVNLGRATKVLTVSMGEGENKRTIGVSFDIRMEIPTEVARSVYDNILSAKNDYRDFNEVTFNELRKTNYKFAVDVNLPETGLILNGAGAKKIVEDNWDVIQTKVILPGLQGLEIPIEGKTYYLTKETRDSIVGLRESILQGIGSSGEVSTNSLRFELRNNLGNTNEPVSLYVIAGNKEIPVTLKDSYTKDLIRDSLRATVYAPDILERGTIPNAYGSTLRSLPAVGPLKDIPKSNQNFYGFNPWLQRMAYDNLGLNENRYVGSVYLVAGISTTNLAYTKRMVGSVTKAALIEGENSYFGNGKYFTTDKPVEEKKE